MKKFFITLMCIIMVVCFMPTMAFAGETSQETQISWEDGKTVEYAGTQYESLAAALTVVYKRPPDDTAVLNCKPGANVGSITHGHVADSITINGNGAYVSGGEYDLEVDTFKFDRTTGVQSDAGELLTKDITVSVDSLNGIAAWGQRNTTHTVNLVFTNCKDMNRVYISGTSGINNITLKDCSFNGTAANANPSAKNTSVYSNAPGKITLDNCDFTNVAIPINLNNKSTGKQEININGCSFADCATTSLAEETNSVQYAAAIRIVAANDAAVSEVKISDTAISYTGETTNVGNGDILLGDGRNGKDSAGKVQLAVVGTKAEIQQQEPGYYTDSTTDSDKLKSLTVTDEEIATTKEDGTFQTAPLTNYVTVNGIKGLDGKKFTTIANAYAAGKAILEQTENGGLGQNALSNNKFDEIFTDNGNITWTIYGTHDYDEEGQSYLLTFGRKAKHYSTERHIGTVKLQGGNNDRAKDVVNFKTNVTLNYEWWGCNVPDKMVVDSITLNVEKTDQTKKDLKFTQAFNDGIDLTINNCVVNGGLYFYNNNKNVITFTNNVFNGLGGKYTNAFHIQGHETKSTIVTITGNAISGYVRSMNLDQKTGEFTIKNNTITPGTGYSAIQISRGKTATIEGNEIILNDKTNVLTIHESFAKDKLTAEITVKNNTIKSTGNKAYLVYDDVNASGKAYGEDAANVTLKWENNKISGKIDFTKGVKGEQEFDNSEYIRGVLKKATNTPSGGSYTPVQSELEKAKTEATTTVSTSGTANKYDEAEQAEVNKIIEKAKADIKNAKTVEEVKAIQDAAQAEIEKILTSDEKAQITAVKGVNSDVFKAKSKLTKLNGKRAVKVTWNVPKGMKIDGYEIFRSTERYSGFGTEPYFTTTKTSYTNNKDLKPGKTYYYKVRGYVLVNGEKIYTGFSTKAFRTIK